ncbi:hypothetical protein [Pleomorphochaeta sp. DL1XJH-081]|jgi:hypothetical protein|uniref:hypothetical protein n=1 Tax=Pleomorphochaeta sp. DL1XJH-081 TaxID=3409690 RepID=UPI003BB511F3
MLPMLMRFRIHDESKTFGFYLPMVLIYLLALPVVVLGAIVFAILLAVPETAKQARAYLRLIMALPQLLSASIGTEIEVQSETKDIVIRII